MSQSEEYVETQLLDEVISYLDEEDIKVMERHEASITIQMSRSQSYHIYIHEGAINTAMITNGIRFDLSSFQIADPDCFDKIKKALTGEME